MADRQSPGRPSPVQAQKTAAAARQAAEVLKDPARAATAARLAQEITRRTQELEAQRKRQQDAQRRGSAFADSAPQREAETELER